MADTNQNAPPAETPPAVPEKLCAKDLALNALAAQRDEYAAKLAAETKRADTAEAALATLKAENERAPLVAELATLAPDFKADGLAPDVLKTVLAALKTAPKAATPATTGGRRTALAATTPDPKATADAQKSNLRKLMGLPGSQ